MRGRDPADLPLAVGSGRKLHSQVQQLLPRPWRDPRLPSGWLAGIGHNPLGGISLTPLLADTALPAGLGLIAQDEDGIYAGPLAGLVSSDTSDRATAIHEVNFYILLALIGLHVAAILFYRLRGRSLVMPMITGKAVLPRGTAPMRPGHWWVALLCLAVAIGVTRWFIAGAPPFGP